jgi:glyoxylase-like metal-dependent hydrolase (beta-lactamase superfamily II)
VLTRRHLVLAAPLVALSGPRAFAQQDFSQVQVRATQLSPTVWMLVGAGGNVGLCAGEDSVFVVDNQFAPMAPKLVEAIKAVSPKPVQFVLNTHYHFDHTGGNEPFGRAGALIVAHDSVRRRLSAEQTIAFFNARQAPTPKAGLPVVTVAGEMRFHINGEELHAFHVPRAHTDGDLIVHFRGSDVVHMGDTYFNGTYPFIDGGGGGSAEGLIAAHDRVLALATDKTKIIPGHGPLSNKAELQAYRDMLATIVKRVADARRAGQSDAQILQARITADFDGKYGGGFIKAEAWMPMLLGVTGR